MNQGSDHIEQLLASLNRLQILGYKTLGEVTEVMRIAPLEVAALVGDTDSVRASPILTAQNSPMRAELTTQKAISSGMVAIPSGANLPLGRNNKKAFAFFDEHPNIPREVNLISDKSRIADQGLRSTCVAFAVIAAAENQWKESPPPELSAQHLYFECKENDPTGETGTYVQEAFHQLVMNGACLASTWPYNPNLGSTEGQGPPPSQTATEALGHRIPGSIELVPTSVSQIKNQLAKGNCVAITVPVFESWFLSYEVYRTGAIKLPIPNEKLLDRHALCIVGYKDDSETESNPGAGVFIVRNSKGAKWGADGRYGGGYGTIPYKYIEAYGIEAFCVSR